MTLIVLLSVLCLTTISVNAQFWAYDPYTGQTYQTYGYPTSGGLAQKPSTTNVKSTNPSVTNSFFNYNPYQQQSYHHSFPPMPGHETPCVPTPPPKIDWGNCPMLEPKEDDKKMKEDKQKECIKDLELNENATLAELNPSLQKRVRECVLRKNELINEAGKYNYDKVMEKLMAKGVPEDLTKKVEEAHVECKVEAAQKFLNSNEPLAEVESYQDCMDLHLALMCKIKVIKNTGPVGRVNSFHGIPSNEASGTQDGSATSENNKNRHSHDFSEVMDKIQILSQAIRR